jgi:hypothetical protein
VTIVNANSSFESWLRRNLSVFSADGKQLRMLAFADDSAGVKHDYCLLS